MIGYECVCKCTVFFRDVHCLIFCSKLGMQNCKISHDLNPPVEFKSRDILQFYIPGLNHASNLA